MDDKQALDRAAKSFVPADPAPPPPVVANKQLIERILQTPAPVPARTPQTVQRQRLPGAQEKATPQERARAFQQRAIFWLAFEALAALLLWAVADLAGPGALLIWLAVGAVTLLWLNERDYQHSQPGVERQRAKLDYHLEQEHEANRHEETMTAMEQDFALKQAIIDLAARRAGVQHEQ